jgi:hypothetical protein
VVINFGYASGDQTETLCNASDRCGVLKAQMKTKWIFATALAIIIIGAVSIVLLRHKHVAALPSSQHGKGGQIHGVLYSSVDGVDIAIPRLRIVATDNQTGRNTSEVFTDQSGRYVIPKQQPGHYRICWSGVGWVSACAARIVTVSSGTAYLSTNIVVADLSSGHSRTVYGEVTLKDGTPCSISDDFLGVHLQTSVAAREAGGVVLTVMANDAGQYVLPAVSISTIEVEAACAGSVARQLAEGGNDRMTKVPLRFDNTPPEIARLDVRSAPGARGAAPGGSFTVTATAKDLDRNKLEYHWIAEPSLKLLSQAKNSSTWEIPEKSGVYDVTAVVNDSKGGIATRNVSVEAGGGNRTAKLGTLPEEVLNFVKEETAVSPSPTGQLPPTGVPNAGGFLLYKQNDKAAAERYYKAADPQDLRTTLGAWWVVNGFTADGSGGIRTAYMNNNDLGSGRDMHCLAKESGDLACYVTNYGGFDQNPANAILALEAQRNHAIATVAMEYTPIEGALSQDRVVKFFVYQGGEASGSRMLSAALDQFGDKYVPGLCLACHGGNYQPTADPNPAPSEVDLGASFREFDLATFVFPPNSPRPLQEDAFRLQNDVVLKSNPAPAVSDLIHGWYAHGLTQDNTYIPPGWLGKEQLYRDVVVPSCRTCHVALDSASQNSSISWTQYDQFQQERSVIKNYVCGRRKIMPDAQITYRNFWLGGRDKTLATFSASDWATFGSCK